MAQQDLVLTRPDPTFGMEILRAQMEAAKRYVDSGLLPAAIKTPQQALTIMQAGREIGVPATYALRNIHVIEGKPSASAELLMALVRRAYGQSAIRVAEATSESCTVEYRELGWDGVSSLTFSMEDARKAGLATKPMWSKYPRAMLRSRAVSETVRTAFPECIAGLYTPEELGADVAVAADGSLTIVEGQVVNGTPLGASTGTASTTAANGAASAMSSGPATNGMSADDGKFHYGDVRERYAAAAEYERLANLAVERGHKYAQRIKAKQPKDLSDQDLAIATDKLQQWDKHWLAWQKGQQQRPSQEIMDEVAQEELVDAF